MAMAPFLNPSSSLSVTNPEREKMSIFKLIPGNKRQARSCPLPQIQAQKAVAYDLLPISGVWILLISPWLFLKQRFCQAQCNELLSSLILICGIQLVKRLKMTLRECSNVCKTLLFRLSFVITAQPAIPGTRTAAHRNNSQCLHVNIKEISRSSTLLISTLAYLQQQYNRIPERCLLFE